MLFSRPGFIEVSSKRVPEGAAFAPWEDSHLDSQVSVLLDLEVKDTHVSHSDYHCSWESSPLPMFPTLGGF